MGLPFDQKMVVEATEHHFEGFEKRLEVEFQPLLASDSVCERKNLRDLTRNELDNMLTAAQCTIVSQMSNEHLDSYVLSESSLFVYPYCIVIKTCGTTKPLNALPLLLSYASQLSLKVKRCKYTRGTFIFPEDQPFPHSSFSNELAFLETHFGQHLVSQSHVLNDISQKHKWHIYSATAAESSSSPVHTIEMCMTSLDRNCAAKFFKTTCSTAAEMTQESGIAEILPASSINDFAFDPCGYSMNGIEGPACSTIHITPEDGFSYASFEAMGYNPANVNMESLVERVLNCFKPAVFTLSVHLMGSTAGNNSWGSFVHPLGYGCKSFRKETLPGGSAVVYQAFQHLPQTDIEFLPSLYTPKVKKQQHETLDEVYVDAASHNIDDTSLDVNLKMEERLWRLWKKWKTVLPRVQPIFTVRVNPDREILSTLASLGAGFAIASQLELDTVLKLGISRNCIIFRNPCNSMLSSDVREAGNHGVCFTAFHSASELYKLKEWNPHVEALLCIGGEEEENEWGPVLKTARMLGVKVAGIAFHVQSEEKAATLIGKGIKQAKAVYEAALALGFPPLRLLDISAVASANVNKSLFESAGDAMNTALDTYFPQSLGVTVIAESGRFFGGEKKQQQPSPPQPQQGYSMQKKGRDSSWNLSVNSVWSRL